MATARSQNGETSRMDTWCKTRCAGCGGLGFTDTMDRCRVCGGTGTIALGAGAVAVTAMVRMEVGSVGVEREGHPAERTPLPGTDAGPRRLDRKRVVLALRPVCVRCRGRLFLEPAALPDGSRELVCLNCGARSYYGGTGNGNSNGNGEYEKHENEEGEDREA